MRRVLGPVLLVVGGFLAATAAASVTTTVHNLSPTGPGEIRAAEAAGVCEFCHTPHRASPVAALWNRATPGTSYIPYSSTTAVASPGQPTGASLLCLSCHDGTVALGEVLSRGQPIAMVGGVTTMPPGPARTGTDLRHHHPVSFVYDAGLAGERGELALPSSLPREIEMDSSGQMQCTSCHDPHDDSYGDFLVLPNTNSALCVECHQKSGWSGSSHASSGRTWNGVGADPWPRSDQSTVAANGCRNCHETHQTGGGPVLLRQAVEEDNCAACHNGNVAEQDVMALFNQISSHPISATTGVHDAAESAVVSARHVECADCHDPHQAGGGVRGVNLGNSEVDPVTEGYQVCLRCHGDSPGKGVPLVRRQLDQNNVRLEIQLDNPSFHPVAGPGRNPDMPSLIAPYTPQSIVDCVDCHNSNSAASLGGSGPEGPHGSSFEPILARNYVTSDNTPESPSAYALCYSCHSRSSILGDDSFGEHRLHVEQERTPCSVCHDPHGVSATQGNTVNNTHLINFDTTVVRPSSQGLLRFVDLGRHQGSCDLACHGENHTDERY